MTTRRRSRRCGWKKNTRVAEKCERCGQEDGRQCYVCCVCRGIVCSECSDNLVDSSITCLDLAHARRYVPTPSKGGVWRDCFTVDGIVINWSSLPPEEKKELTELTAGMQREGVAFDRAALAAWRMIMQLMGFTEVGAPKSGGTFHYGAKLEYDREYNRTRRR